MAPLAPPVRTPMPVLSVSEIRSHFPALERTEAGRPAAFFDGPGGTQVPRSVADAMTAYLFERNANTHWEYATSRETDAAIDDARRTMADFLGCTPEGVVFGANTTTLLFHLTRAIGRGLGPGDEIVVTRLDHQANVGPWREMARERGCTVVEVPFDPGTGTLDMDAMRRSIGPATRWVACGAASNAIGTITDVAAVAEMARGAGARLFVDAVHFAPHARVDVSDLGVDALGCSPYKFHGPHMGTLFVDPELAASLDVPRLVCGGSEPPDRLETGTLSHEGMMGSAAAVDFLADLAGPGTADDRRARLTVAFDELHHRGAELLERMWTGLEAIDGVTLFGPPPGAPRTPTVGFTVAGHPADRVTAMLSDRHGIFTSHGDFYATTVIEDLGLAPHGLVRAGCACYTTEDEVDRLVAGVREIAAG